MQAREWRRSSYADYREQSLLNSNLLEAEPTETIRAPRISLRNLLHIVFRRKWLVLSFFVVCAAGSITLLVLLFSKPTFLATSQLLISPAREQVVQGATASAVPWLGFNAVEQTAWTVEMLKGRFLAERVVRTIGPTVLYPSSPKENLDLLGLISNGWQQRLSASDERMLQHEEAIRTFLKNVDAKPAGRSSIVELSFRHGDPESAARAVNLLSEMYIERHLGVQRNAETDAFFHEQLVTLKNKLAESQEEIRAFKQRHGITGAIDEERHQAIHQMSSLEVELNNTRSGQPQVQTRAAELRKQLGNAAPTPGKIQQMREKLTTLEIQENALSLGMTAQHPTLLNLRKEIQTLRQKLVELEGADLYGTSSSESLHASLEEEVLRNEAEAKALHAREEAQTTKLAEYRTRLSALERIQPEFNRLQNQLRTDENNYRLYLTKFEESRIARAMDAQKIAGVRVIEEARPPLRPIDSNRNKLILAAILASGVGAVALACVLHALDGSLDTVDDIERVLDLPVLASIPEFKSQLINGEVIRSGDPRAGILTSTNEKSWGAA